MRFKMAARRLLPILLMAASIQRAFPENLALSSAPVYERTIGHSLVIVQTDRTIRIIVGGRITESIGPIPDLVGIDSADVAGNGQEDLVLILKNGVSVVALSGGEAQPSRFADFETLYSKFDVVNSPRSIRLFSARDKDGKAYPVWFGADGLFVFKDGKSKLISKESPRALINLLGTQISMPGEETVSVGFPRYYAYDIDGDGTSEIAYIKGGVLKLDKGRSSPPIDILSAASRSLSLRTIVVSPSGEVSTSISSNQPVPRSDSSVASKSTFPSFFTTSESSSSVDTRTLPRKSC